MRREGAYEREEVCSGKGGGEARWSRITWASHSRLEGLSHAAAGAVGAWTRGLWMPCGPKPWDLQKPPGTFKMTDL